jgi:EF-hand domain-containing family member B
MSVLSASTRKFDTAPNIRAAGRNIVMGPTDGVQFCV